LVLKSTLDAVMHYLLLCMDKVTKCFIKKGIKVYCAFLDASKAFGKELNIGLFVKLLKKDVSVRFVRILQNCVRPFHGMVLSVMFLLFSLGHDKVEFYHLCCSENAHLLFF